MRCAFFAFVTFASFAALFFDASLHADAKYNRVYPNFNKPYATTQTPQQRLNTNRQIYDRGYYAGRNSALNSYYYYNAPAYDAQGMYLNGYGYYPAGGYYYNTYPNYYYNPAPNAYYYYPSPAYYNGAVIQSDSSVNSSSGGSGSTIYYQDNN